MPDIYFNYLAPFQSQRHLSEKSQQKHCNKHVLSKIIENCLEREQVENYNLRSSHVEVTCLMIKKLRATTAYFPAKQWMLLLLVKD